MTSGQWLHYAISLFDVIEANGCFNFDFWSNFRYQISVSSQVYRSAPQGYCNQLENFCLSQGGSLYPSLKYYPEGTAGTSERDPCSMVVISSKGI